jgi:predicted DNA-binding transcriptional regulator YafY
MPSNKTRHTLARQWELLKRLPSRSAGKTASELTQELQDAGFEVSKRQVERDLGELMEAFDLDCNNGSIPYGWRWLPGASADLPGLTIAEAMSLRLVEDLVRPMLPASLLHGLESRFRQAEKKLDSLAEENPAARWLDKVRTVLPTQPFLAPQINAEVLATVQECLLTDEQIDAEYLGVDATETSKLRLNPLGLVTRGHVTYLVATAWRYTDVRLYALHRISTATRTYEVSVRPKGFDLDAYIASGALQFGNNKSLRMKARISEYMAHILSETPLAEDQVIKGDMLTATVQDTWQLNWWILGQGDAIEVISPAALRKAICQTLGKAVTNYSREREENQT